MDKMARFAQMNAMEKSAEKGNYENWNMQQMMMQQMMMQNQMMNNQMANNNQQTPQQQQPPQQQANSMSRDEVMKALKDLGELKQMGILTDEEFETKKKELLAKL